jgi:hypothetical protein
MRPLVAATLVDATLRSLKNKHNQTHTPNSLAMQLISGRTYLKSPRSFLLAAAFCTIYDNDVQQRKGLLCRHTLLATSTQREDN